MLYRYYVYNGVKYLMVYPMMQSNPEPQPMPQPKLNHNISQAPPNSSLKNMKFYHDHDQNHNHDRYHNPYYNPYYNPYNNPYYNPYNYYLHEPSKKN